MFRTHNQLVPMRDAAILEELNLYSTQIVLRSALHATNRYYNKEGYHLISNYALRRISYAKKHEIPSSSTSHPARPAPGSARPVSAC